jgi:hypothetical protein
VLRHSKVRRAQLYYFRNLRGKSARLRERLPTNKTKAANAADAPAETAPAES